MTEVNFVSNLEKSSISLCSSSDHLFKEEIIVLFKLTNILEEKSKDRHLGSLLLYLTHKPFKHSKSI